MSKNKKREKKGPAPRKERKEDVTMARILILGVILTLFVITVIAIAIMR